MKWSLQELNKYKEDNVEFDEEIVIEESIKARYPEILSITPVKVKGLIAVNKTEYIAHFTFQTILTLPSSRSLTPVEFPLTLAVDEIYMTPTQFANKNEYIDAEEILVLEDEVLNLYEAVEDHILLSIPLQILTEAEQESSEMPKGDFWEIVSEAEFEDKKAQQKKSEIDPRLAKLSALLENNDQTDEE